MVVLRVTLNLERKILRTYSLSVVCVVTAAIQSTSTTKYDNKNL
jgi:hypothetical protein